MITIEDINKLQVSEAQNLEILEQKGLTGISIDSRTTTNTELFFAIKGERYDAHAFLPDVISRGVGACCVEEDWFHEHRHSFHETVFIVVENTTLSLGALANIYRHKFKIPFVAVAGSNGKTTTKEMLGCVLSQQFNVLKTEGNLNNHIGVPLTLFNLNKEHEVAVVEIGTNHFGEIEYLCNILEPDYSVMTNIGREHLEFFKNIEGVAEGEGELFNYIANAGKHACINTDDNWIVKKSKNIVNKITYGFNPESIVCAQFNGLDAMALPDFQVRYQDTVTKIKLQVPGEHAVSNAIAAFAVGVVLGLPAEKIKMGLQSYTAFSKRMEVVRKKGVTIINDCYNANPDSMLAALKTLSQIKAKGKRIAVLGDMAELGEQSKQAHIEMGSIIQAAGIDCLYTYGTDIELTVNAVGTGLQDARHFFDKNSLIACLQEILQQEDVILVKGSRSMKLEEVIESVMN